MGCLAVAAVALVRPGTAAMVSRFVSTGLAVSKMRLVVGSVYQAWAAVVAQAAQVVVAPVARAAVVVAPAGCREAA